MFDLNTIITILGLLGLGTIIGAFFQSRFEYKRDVKKKEHELKWKRYAAISIQMLTKLNPEESLPKIKKHRPDLILEHDLDKELETELLNGALFMSRNVIKNLRNFLDSPTNRGYIKTMNSMRKDLWGFSLWKNRLIIDEFEIKK